MTGSVFKKFFEAKGGPSKFRSLATVLVALFFVLTVVAHGQIYVVNGNKIGKYDASTGSAINASFITGLSTPYSLVLDNGHLYVSSMGATSSNAGTVGEYDAITGAPINASLVTGLSILYSNVNTSIWHGPTGIAVAGGKLFVEKWNGTMGEYDAATGTLVNIALYSGVASYNMATTGTSLYVTNFSLGTIGQYSPTGGAANASFATGLNGYPEGIAVSGNNLFVAGAVTNPSGIPGWYSTTPETISEYDATTGAAINTALVSGLNPSTYAIATSGGHLFVTNLNDGTIGEYNATTGATINATLVSGLTSPEGIVVADPPPLASLHFQNGTLLGVLSLATSFLPSAWTGVGAMNAGWQERVIADIDGDGTPDLIFQNGTSIGALIMNPDGTPHSWIGIGAMGSGWELRGAADLALNGQLNLIFQNGTLLGNLSIDASGVPVAWTGMGAMGAGWNLHAVADLNGDGHADLLFQNGTSLGVLQVGTNSLPTAWNLIGTMTTGWTLSDAMDVDGGGQPDLIFQNSTSLGALQVNASFQPTAWHGIGAMGSGWTLPGDY